MDQVSARLTEQERVCFYNVDRQIPGSSLVSIANGVAERVEEETKKKLFYGHLSHVLTYLVDIREEVADGHHRGGHENPTVNVERCLACKTQVAIDLIMEATE